MSSTKANKTQVTVWINRVYRKWQTHTQKWCIKCNNSDICKVLWGKENGNIHPCMGIAETLINNTWGKRKENFQTMTYHLSKGRGMEQYEMWEELQTFSFFWNNMHAGRSGEWGWQSFVICQRAQKRCDPSSSYQTHSKFTLPFVSDPCQLYSLHLFLHLSSTEVIKDRKTKLSESRDFP